MNIKRTLLLAVIPIMSLAVHAQKCDKKDNLPKKGDFTIATTIGYNSYTGITAQQSWLTDYEAAAFSTNWTDKKLMIGFEAGWFFKDLWKLNLGGGINFTNNPGYPAVPGTVDGTAEEGDGTVPNYRSVADAYSFAYNVAAGVDRYFNVSKIPGLMCYTGFRVGFAYGLNEMKYDEPESMGKSIGETYNLRGALTFGVDYFLLPALYVGCQIDPFAYTYNYTTYKPQEGLANLSADSHNFGFLAAPTLKIGFKF